MSRFALRLLSLLLFGASASCVRAAGACNLLARLPNDGRDMARALTDCLAELPPGARLSLAARTYILRTPIVVDRPVTIATAAIPDDGPGCADLGPNRCATILIDPQSRTTSRQMPVEIRANGVTLTHLIIRSSGETPERRAECRIPASRPMGGGLRVSASGFTLTKSVLRGFACYTSLEITKGAERPTIRNDVIGPNGDHGPDTAWSDGVTISDSDHALVGGNLFVGNTDVQLIFGGCRDCRVEENQFRHSGAFSSASFAELMLQSWPSTSGDYSGTVVSGNSIDCSPQRSCGYGIMVGAAPWYEGRTSGGTIVANSVSNAMIGINVDGLTGPVEIRNNVVRSSGGRFASDCGMHDWPGVNVAPTSRKYVRGDISNLAQGSVSTAHCLLNRPPRSK